LETEKESFFLTDSELRDLRNVKKASFPSDRTLLEKYAILATKITEHLKAFLIVVVVPHLKSDISLKIAAQIIPYAILPAVQALLSGWGCPFHLIPVIAIILPILLEEWLFRLRAKIKPKT
jgi:hypothetical protein